MNHLPLAAEPESARRDGPLAFTLDLNRCTGCRACELACGTENDLPWGSSWRRVYTFNPDLDPRLAHYHLSLACNHCEAAPCMEACPARAFSRHAATGAVELDPDLCMGCGYCGWACPFEAPWLDETTHLMGKCTLCPSRVEAGREPACVEACPTEALGIETRVGPFAAEVPGGFPVTDARPSIRFEPLRRGGRPPVTTWQVDPQLIAAFEEARSSRGGNRAPAGGGPGREGPLLVFTLLMPLLVALWTIAPWDERGSIAPALLAAGALVAGAVSTLHLGRKRRAWRAVLGARSSWLSREILGYGLFTVLAVIDGALTAWNAPGRGLGGVLEIGISAAGWVTLLSIDRVYDPVRRPRNHWLHSADTLPIAVTFTLLLAAWADLPGALPLLLTALGLRAALYLARKRRIHRRGRLPPRSLAALRLGVGFLLPAALLASGAPGAPILAMAGTLLGEIIDRSEFYLDLSPLTPGETIARSSEEGLTRSHPVDGNVPGT